MKKVRFLLELDEMQYCSTNLSKISLKFTDRRPILADLSVNFELSLWGFTDKRLFLEYLSVKPG